MRTETSIVISRSTHHEAFESTLLIHRGSNSRAISVLERDPRCQMIALDPDTAAPNPEVLSKVARVYDGTARIYGAVLAEGMIRAGDPVEILD